MKWEAVLLMALLVLLGFLLVYGPGTDKGIAEIQIDQSKAALVEVTPSDADERTFMVRYRDAPAHGPVTESALRAVYGDAKVRRMLSGRENALFRLLNITTWASLPWVVVGFGAQLVFASRFIIQWIVSERRRESVIPVAFWWVSFFGGVTLFAYFVWRQDPVGVLGQSSGIVIYARNLRLIHKKRRRERRLADLEAEHAGEREPEGKAESPAVAEPKRPGPPHAPDELPAVATPARPQREPQRAAND